MICIYHHGKMYFPKHVIDIAYVGTMIPSLEVKKDGHVFIHFIEYNNQGEAWVLHNHGTTKPMADIEGITGLVITPDHQFLAIKCIKELLTGNEVRVTVTYIPFSTVPESFNCLSCSGKVADTALALLAHGELAPDVIVEKVLYNLGYPRLGGVVTMTIEELLALAKPAS